MKRAAFLVIPLLLANGTALAAQSNGNAALAFAAIVGAQSPVLQPSEKKVLARFLAGETNFTLPAGVRRIIVKAGKVTCRLGDVDITEHSCTLTFGAAAKTETGGPAQGLLATMIENGVQADGAAGTIFYSVSPLVCTIDAPAVQSKGGGALCTYTNGP
jgi:hypothetical protein